MNTAARRTLIGLVLIGVAATTVFVWQDSKRRFTETELAIYRDPTQPIDVRVEDLLQRMTIDEKIGQVVLVEKNSIHFKPDIARYVLGALLSGGGANPDPNTPADWLNMVKTFHAYSQQTRLQIPLLYGVDALHGHTNVPGATVFPHAIGLGASRDVDLVRRVAQATAAEMAATGVYWNFSPNLDVAQDSRWGRMYETFGSDPAVVSKLGVAYLAGLHSPEPGFPLVIGTAKHYLGSGAMAWGTSGNPDYKIDQGIIGVDEATLRAVHLPPFDEAVKAGVSSIMVGHATWEGGELAASRYWLTDVLKGELGFTGFVVSDWYGVYEISGGEYNAVVTAINAGVDMVMLPYDYKSFIQYMRTALERGDIPVERLDDAVRRIVRAKFTAGLFDRVPGDGAALSVLGSSDHRALAREAVRKSLVLLKNERRTVPVSKNTPRIIVAGSSSHNIGRQSGGWTVEWQGIDGNWIPGTSILDAIKRAASEATTVEHNVEGDFDLTKPLADIGIAVVGEAPYAEGWGDNEHPALSTSDMETIAKVKEASKKLVVIIVSGRPLDIRPYVSEWDAVVAAWLPGSEGQGVADVLFGDYAFTGRLPVSWKIK